MRGDHVRDPVRHALHESRRRPAILVRLADRGLLETSWEPRIASRPPRHLYRLTGAGREFVAALTAAGSTRAAAHPRSRLSEA
jgi:PadR family transcriptional regulator PadR